MNNKRDKIEVKEIIQIIKETREQCSLEKINEMKFEASRIKLIKVNPVNKKKKKTNEQFFCESKSILPENVEE